MLGADAVLEVKVGGCPVPSVSWCVSVSVRVYLYVSVFICVSVRVCFWVLLCACFFLSL